jgi:hypothetical protein
MRLVSSIMADSLAYFEDELENRQPLTITVTREPDLTAFIGTGQIPANFGINPRYTVSFSEPITESVILALPRDSSDVTYQAIINQNGDIFGGRYNPATGMIEGRINADGTYIVINNFKDFSEIHHLEAEMQNAIRYLASKGIIDDTLEDTFVLSPEDSITRAEIAALVIRAIAKYDPNLDGKYDDVFPWDWYFGAAGSSRRHGIIGGFEDNTFRGLSNMLREQIITIAVNTLILEMNYLIDVDIEREISRYSDSHDIPEWAQLFIAIGSRINLIAERRDGLFLPGTDMTRGDAAIIIRRLFDKLW